jgi:hypothetical protein
MLKACCLFIWSTFLFLSSTRAITVCDSIRMYYTLVHSAEHFIIQENYVMADSLYDSAFRFKKPFAIDVYNKLLCDLNGQNNAGALSDCLELINKGAPLLFFKQSFFDNFRGSKQYTQLLSSYNNLHQKFQKRLNANVVLFLKKLVSADQIIHCLLPTRYNDSSFVDSMRLRDDSFSVILCKIMTDNQFLNEDVIGANFENDTVLNPLPIYGVIAIHEIQRGGRNVNSVLMQAVKSGAIKSELVNSWLSQAGAPKLNLTRLYSQYNDTLWRRNETALLRKMYENMIGTSEEEYAHDLREFYLDDKNFMVEERIIYNFHKEAAKSEKKYLFFILPDVPYIISSFEGGDEARNLQFFYQSNTPIATK